MIQELPEIADICADRRIGGYDSIRRLLLAYIMLSFTGSSTLSVAQALPLRAHELDQLVARIALYPDPLLANVLTASTYWNEIPDAAAWANAHSHLKGDALATAMQADHLQWDPNVLALLPFPGVLAMMARDMDWTKKLGNAVLYQDQDVMDAVQRLRHQAMSYGYLRPNRYMDVVDDDGYIEISPVNPSVVYVPAYDPAVVFAPPRPGFAVAEAIRFGPAITIGGALGKWGWWYGSGFRWASHTIVIDRRPWRRVWANRVEYVHPYAEPWVRPAGPRVETHGVNR
jgi:hypothetical protein